MKVTELAATTDATAVAAITTLDMNAILIVDEVIVGKFVREEKSREFK